MSNVYSSQQRRGALLRQRPTAYAAFLLTFYRGNELYAKIGSPRYHGHSYPYTGNARLYAETHFRMNGEAFHMRAVPSRAIYRIN